MSEIIGVALPIPKKFIDRFFEQGKTVFIKPATIYKELKKGQKFIFYQSQQDVGYFGEAIIKTIELHDNPLVFFDIFGEQIFLKKSEVKEYIDQRKKWTTSKDRSIQKRGKKPWMAIELEKIKKYSEVKKIDGFVPVSGIYLRK